MNGDKDVKNCYQRKISKESGQAGKQAAIARVLAMASRHACNSLRRARPWLSVLRRMAFGRAKGRSRHCKTRLPAMCFAITGRPTMASHPKRHKKRGASTLLLHCKDNESAPLFLNSNQTIQHFHAFSTCIRKMDCVARPTAARPSVRSPTSQTMRPVASATTSCRRFWNTLRWRSVR